MTSLKPYLTLCRIHISLFAACSAATGFLLAPHHQIAALIIPFTAVLLLASGASALNQYQERDIDANMERTRLRPIPTGTFKPAEALSIALVLITGGLLMLLLTVNTMATALGLIAVLWYNGIYTHLKKITAFASIPGAIVGMIPPAIGWVSADGSLFNMRLMAVCFIFFMWQVPHFWLLILNHGEEYEQAGLPSLTRVMSKPQIARITYAWIVAAAIASLALPLYGSVRTPIFYAALFPLGAWIIWSVRFLKGGDIDLSSTPLFFRKINIYIFLIMSLLSIENIILLVP